MAYQAVKLLVAAGLAMQVSADHIRIDAGKNGQTFSPNKVTAKKGDVLEFHFFPQNHNVVMGSFTTGCSPATSGGFFSGSMPTQSGENPNVFSVTVNSTDPMVFYCATGQHCKNGMYGVVNEGGSSTLDNYKTLAAAAGAGAAPASAFGGTVGPASNGTHSGTNAAGAVKAGVGSLVGAVAAALMLV